METKDSRQRKTENVTSTRESPKERVILPLQDQELIRNRRDNERRDAGDWPGSKRLERSGELKHARALSMSIAIGVVGILAGIAFSYCNKSLRCSVRTKDESTKHRNIRVLHLTSDLESVSLRSVYSNHD